MTRSYVGCAIPADFRIVRTVGRPLPHLTLLLAAALLLVQPIAGAAGLDAQAPPESAEVLRPGDVVRIQVWRQAEFSGEFEVTESGAIAHPLYREVNGKEARRASGTSGRGWRTKPTLFSTKTGREARTPHMGPPPEPEARMPTRSGFP